MEKRRIIVNIICSLLLQVVTIVSGFILPKIIISSLGSETNGLVASINQFLNYGQFIKNALNKENIVLKSKGEQRRTYSYVVDVVSGIFKVLFKCVRW